MIKYEDNCVGCPPEMGCLGSACSNRNVPVFVCDDCGCEDETLYYFDGEELCLDCIKERLEEVEA